MTATVPSPPGELRLRPNRNARLAGPGQPKVAV